MSKNVEVKGRKFNSISEACRYFGKSYSSVMGRVSKGYSLEEALVKEDGRGKKGSSVKVVDKVYSSLREACSDLGVSFDTCKQRLKSGRTLEEALGVVEFANKGKSVEVQGVEYPSISEARRAYGVTCNELYSRLRRGLSLEEALTVRRDMIEIGGKEFKSFSEACRYYGVNRNTAEYQKRKGKSLEDIFGIE